METVCKYKSPMIAKKWNGAEDKHPAVHTLSNNSDTGWVWTKQRHSLIIRAGDWLVYDPSRDVYEVFTEDEFKNLFEKTENK